MAQRFGGKYSPGGDTAAQGGGGRNPFDGKTPDRGLARTNMLFVVALFMLIPVLRGTGQHGLVLAVGATALLLLAAWLTREGVRAHLAYDARDIARRPAAPRKIIAAVLTGAGVALGAAIGHPDVLAILGSGGAAVVLHLVAFGPDPLRDKGMSGVDRFATERVAAAVDEAEALLTQMRDAILRANDRAVATRVDQFCDSARALFRTVESDPGDLTAARKYLTVYLTGARDATVKFADLYARTRDAQARTDYLALLDELSSTYAQRSTALLSNNRSDLDIEISVLRDRLAREQ